ncbi:MAG: UDP-N-acetylmuramoyl-L-alanine--D-glutamate ligase [Candidatus Omnitrophica bacterium]|nr:UDP-N-acetylmuramoyl-L-alanine--D-glutamate ligase [Candidatus Omnitrophota bacterium]
MNVGGKKVLVVGLGVSGYASGRLLARRGAKVKITEEVDSDSVQENVKKLLQYPAEFEIGRHTRDFCDNVDLVVTSPGVDSQALPLLLAREKQIPVIGELELGFRFCEAPIIAITGTNGKSTTVELIGNILALSGKHTVICGNIGNPLAGEVEKLTPGSVAVVEVSSFQLETVKEFRPHAAILLNVSEDHYDRHGDHGTYKREKFRVFENQSSGDWAVLHSDLCGDSLTADIKSRVVFFGGENTGSSGSISVNMNGGPEHIIKRSEVPLKGEHNMDNVSCAALVGRIMGVSDRVICDGIRSFKPLAHRFEKVADYMGVEFIDDSKATNIDATRRALRSMEKKVVLIAGGRDKGGDYTSMLPLMKERVKALVLIGEARDKMKNVFSSEVSVFEAKDMAEAVRRGADIASRGEAVMLSPMCSSFDMYLSYKERGDVFQSEVKKILEEN